MLANSDAMLSTFQVVRHSRQKFDSFTPGFVDYSPHKLLKLPTPCLFISARPLS
jgi:hypothetical protein